MGKTISLIVILCFCFLLLSACATTASIGEKIEVIDGEFKIQPDKLIEILNQAAETASQKYNENITKIPTFKGSGKELDLGGGTIFNFETAKSGNVKRITLQWNYRIGNRDSLMTAGFYTSLIPTLFEGSEAVDLNEKLDIKPSEELITNYYSDRVVEYNFYQIDGYCWLDIMPKIK